MENNIGYILCKVWRWPVVKDKHIKMKARIHVLGIFVFDLDGECKFIKKQNNIVIKEICSSGSINRISSYSSNQGSSQEVLGPKNMQIANTQVATT